MIQLRVCTYVKHERGSTLFDDGNGGRGVRGYEEKGEILDGEVGGSALPNGGILGAPLLAVFARGGWVAHHILEKGLPVTFPHAKRP